jgi:hypothetical protein
MEKKLLKSKTTVSMIDVNFLPYFDYATNDCIHKVLRHLVETTHENKCILEKFSQLLLW